MAKFANCVCSETAVILTRGEVMKTSIDIDDDLMRKAMRASGATTKAPRSNRACDS